MQKDIQPPVQLAADWFIHLASEFEQDYMQNLSGFLKSEIKKGKTIYPHGKNIFNALNITTFDLTKVVILGQDPYHGPGQAHGMSFSVPPGVALPPSLVNIFEELKNDLGIAPSRHGNLTGWARQGVLLLNTVLTVEKGKAASHRGRGWETFTDRVIQVLNSKKEKLVFLLWGSHAQEKGKSIDQTKHLVLKAPHPSPLSAYRGFFGSRPFSKINHHLADIGHAPIDWRISSDYIQ
ncbi:MAG: uracil-DNA glycosylase [Halobacteriovoraceae bacterium]|nr:uracil-DNA glycosylase [Halobacteriovoraceae bacterium]